MKMQITASMVQPKLFYSSMIFILQSAWPFQKCITFSINPNELKTSKLILDSYIMAFAMLYTLVPNIRGIRQIFFSTMKMLNKLLRYVFHLLPHHIYISSEILV